MKYTSLTRLFVFTLAAATLMVSGVLAATVTLAPNAQGAYSAWTGTGCTAANGYQCVDENPVSTVDFVSSSTAGQKDSFAFANANLPSSINGTNGSNTTYLVISSVSVNYDARRATTTKKCFDVLTRQAGTDSTGNNICTTGSYVTYSQTFNTNPATGVAWTSSEVDSLEAGMTTAAASGGARVARVRATVTYSYI